MASPVVEVLTKGIGELDLREIDVYRKTGGYAQLERAVKELGQEKVMELATGSNLRGRGGAGFPTGRKWSFLPNNGRPRYMVCNCDEAEPGTFKDHMLLEETPHQVIEGMLIGAYAIASHHAFIYIRGEFRRGYETALLNSLEGKRGEPRLKPPFPAVEGLYGMPTVVNNVETLAYLVPILERGAQWFAAVGTERSKGYKIVSVSGHVCNPGNYEIALGTTIRELIDIAGGLRPGRKLMAVQPGGGSSACVFEEQLDWPYDYESLAKAGSMLGSGAMVVFDDTTDFVKAAYNLARFFAHESCGQCTPCREGGDWIARVLNRLVSYRGVPGDIQMLSRVSSGITGLNLCPLGDSIEPFLKSVMVRFPGQFEARILTPQAQPA